MIEQLKSMYENSLWSSLVHIAPYALSLYGSESDLDPKSDKSGRKRHQVLVMIADAYFETKEFKKAENLYKEAIQLRKQFKVVKKSELGAVDQSADEFQTEGKLALNSTDVEVKFKLHLCYIYTNQVRNVFCCFLFKICSYTKYFEHMYFRSIQPLVFFKPYQPNREQLNTT